MKILVVNWNDRTNPHAGGAEIHLHEIFGRVVGMGHTVHLIASGWPDAPAETVIDGIQLRRVGGRSSFAIKARGAVRRALKEDRYDVVVEDINKLPLYLPLVTALPFCAIVPHLFGTTAYVEASWPIATAVWAAEQAIPRVYAGAWFQVISNSTRDDLIDRGVRRDRIEVIYPGIDAIWYSPDPAVPRAPRPTFLYVGRLKRYKGVDIALRALALAHTERRDLVLQIAGAGEDRARLEALAQELKISAQIQFLGFVSEEEKRRLLRTAWAVVFPSPKEGWGISNIEAAACGTPALASNSPGLRETVRDGETGYLVPHGFDRALAERMLDLAGDPALVARLGAAARFFAAPLTWERAAQATAAHLERVIASGR